MNELIKNAQRIVFKFGTNVLRNENGEISLSRVYSFVEDLSKLYKQGKEIIIVTSGAVGLGAKKLGVDSSESMAVKQACAACGQSLLMSMYAHGFDAYGITVAQILLTEEDFSNRKKYLSLNDTLNTLLSLNAIPIINQNDTVSTEELEQYHEELQICFSDNDKLAALVASKLDADLLVILSDVNGLYDDNPKENPNAHIIPVVEKLDDTLKQYAQNASAGGRGGMKTKLEAANVVTRSGGCALIANGKIPQIISKLFNGLESGTIFLPTESLPGKKRWIAYATNVLGQIVVNDGAKKAILEKDSSLLPIGVVEVRNDFRRGDVVGIVDSNGVEFARGVANYNFSDAQKIAGVHSDKILETLGYKNYDAIVTRDNIVLL
ncbi:glutamate 5-kinase [bacterium]|nr:glutamate 5-kinase [bacterium]